MPRAPRTDVGGLVYHVLNRANARAPLFDDAIDYRSFTELLAEERAHTGMRLLAWCLMPNHWHLVLWPRADGDLARFVRRLTQRHTQARHRRQGTLGQGHLYQGRYKAFLVQDDPHLLAVCRYVERNPLRAGLVTSAADWPHSSLSQLRRRGAGAPFGAAAWVGAMAARHDLASTLRPRGRPPVRELGRGEA
jgi:putative transposase